MYYEYTHGGNIYDKNGRIKKDIIDFSANINPLGIPEQALTAASCSAVQANIYPDSECRELTAGLAEFENVDMSSIFCSNGASDILFRLVYAVKPKRVLVTSPSFADYERAGRAAGAEIIYYLLKKENGFGIDKGITKVISSCSPDIVFVCNPNNPTGNLTGIDTMKEIAAACETANAVLLADECFLDFVSNSHRYSVRPLTGRYKNIVVLKAFTKIFAMPGLRLGYAICGDEKLIDRMKYCGADWSVSNMAQAAGVAALNGADEYIKRTCEYVKAEREYMSAELENMGMTVYPPYANFIFFYCSHSIDLCAELRKQNIAIRDCANFKGLRRGYYRTAVLTGEKNKTLIKAVREVMRAWQNQ